MSKYETICDRAQENWVLINFFFFFFFFFFGTYINAGIQILSSPSLLAISSAVAGVRDLTISILRLLQCI